MSNFGKFIFHSYDFDTNIKTLSLSYGYEDGLIFTESYGFDFPFADYDNSVLDRALQLLFFTAGVSYYKAFAPQEIIVKSGQIDQQMATFLSKTWQKGLGEYWYVNNLDPRTPITFPINSEPLPVIEHSGKGLCVGVGGGKDSLVSIELLRNRVPDLATWSLGHRQQLEPLVDRIELPHYWVERTFDTSLLELKDKPGYKNGHIPISAIFACVGTIVAILTGRRDSVVSNEHSANEPTLTYDGVAINHQYSKSIEFESSFQAILNHSFEDTLRYYSLLRPYSELRIAELFAEYFDTYKDVFCSCNRAFTLSNPRMQWDGACPKCAFVFLALTPFINQAELESLFGGKNLLLDESLTQTYKQLLGIEGDKPLECIGEVQESRAAMKEAFKTYPELATRYTFDLPESYDFRTTYEHSIPEDIEALVKS